MAGKEIKQVLVFLLIGLGALILQTTWLPRHSILGSAPDFLLIIVCCLGLTRGIMTGLMAGALCGFTLGLLNRHFLVTFVIWTITGTASGLSNNNMLNPSRALAGIVAGCGTFLLHFLYWTASALLLKESFYTPPETVVLSCLWNGGISWLVYPWFGTPADTDQRP